MSKQSEQQQQLKAIAKVLKEAKGPKGYQSSIAAEVAFHAAGALLGHKCNVAHADLLLELDASGEVSVDRLKEAIRKAPGRPLKSFIFVQRCSLKFEEPLFVEVGDAACSLRLIEQSDAVRVEQLDARAVQNLTDSRQPATTPIELPSMLQVELKAIGFKEAMDAAHRAAQSVAGAIEWVTNAFGTSYGDLGVRPPAKLFWQRCASITEQESQELRGMGFSNLVVDGIHSGPVAPWKPRENVKQRLTQVCDALRLRNGTGIGKILRDCFFLYAFYAESPLFPTRLLHLWQVLEHATLGNAFGGKTEEVVERASRMCGHMGLSKELIKPSLQLLAAKRNHHAHAAGFDVDEDDVRVLRLAVDHVVRFLLFVSRPEAPVVVLETGELEELLRCEGWSEGKLTHCQTAISAVLSLRQQIENERQNATNRVPEERPRNH